MADQVSFESLGNMVSKKTPQKNLFKAGDFGTEQNFDFDASKDDDLITDYKFSYPLLMVFYLFVPSLFLFIAFYITIYYRKHKSESSSYPLRNGGK